MTGGITRWIYSCIYVGVKTYCSCFHQNCPHSPSHGHICIWQECTDPPGRWTGLSCRSDHLHQDHHHCSNPRCSWLLGQEVHLPINVTFIFHYAIFSPTTSSLFIWAIDTVIFSITDKSQRDAFTTCDTLKFLWGARRGRCHKKNKKLRDLFSFLLLFF